MCIIYLAYDFNPDYPLVVLANRDEFYDRPTAVAGFWDDGSEIFAGRDLVAGGTWMGITDSGRFAAVTNYREPGMPRGSLSRGALVADFLKSDVGPAQYVGDVEANASLYSGFNLLVAEIAADRSELYYFSNRGGPPRKLEPGVYGLSNHLLDTPWPKVRIGKERFHEALRSPLNSDALFSILADESLADDADLPDTGIGYEKEKALSAIFIKTPIYGTRCSTLVTFSKENGGELIERVFA